MRRFSALALLKAASELLLRRALREWLRECIARSCLEQSMQWAHSETEDAVLANGAHFSSKRIRQIRKGSMLCGKLLQVWRAGQYNKDDWQMRDLIV